MSHIQSVQQDMDGKSVLANLLSNPMAKIIMYGRTAMAPNIIFFPTHQPLLLMIIKMKTVFF